MTQLALFDYGQLDTETRIVVQQRTNEIKGLMKRTAQDIIEIGEKLIDVKDRLPHGQFGDWLLGEFDWSQQHARRFMSVAQAFDAQSEQIERFAPSALYLLASPSTPDDVRAEALVRAGEGERITHQAAKAMVSEAKAERAAAFEQTAPPLPQLRPLPEADPEPAPLPPIEDGWACEECGNDMTPADIKANERLCADCRAEVKARTAPAVVESTARPLPKVEPKPEPLPPLPPLPSLVAGEPDWVFTIRVSGAGEIFISAFFDGDSRGLYNGQAATQAVAVQSLDAHLGKFIRQIGADNE